MMMLVCTNSTAGQAGTTGTCTPQPNYDAVATGFANVGSATTGGGTAAIQMVTSTGAFNSAAGGTGAAVIGVMGRLSGTFTIGSNKTIIGMCGSELDGHVQIGGSTNVIVRNLKVVGLNCTDNADCQSGADGISVEASGGTPSTHIWFDHCDISNGSDGNLDITQASDFITVSWTKFSYSGQRAGGHQFSNLMGASDSDTGDRGHLRATWHHNWWGANVGERMPRVRFGQVHLFNNLWGGGTAINVNENACVEVGIDANILIENGVFDHVSDGIDSTNYMPSAATVVLQRGNIYTAVSGQIANRGTGVFTPPYTYANLQDAGCVSAAVMAGAGVH